MRGVHSLRVLGGAALLVAASACLAPTARADGPSDTVPPCRELPPVAWTDTPVAKLDVVGEWRLPRVPSAKELYLQAMCGARNASVWKTVLRGEGAVLEVPPALAESLDEAVPYLPKVRYLYVRGGGLDREVVVILFADGYDGPLFRFDENVPWTLEEAKRAEAFWNALPYELMRRASTWVHDTGKFRRYFSFHLTLLGGLVHIVYDTSGELEIDVAGVVKLGFEVGRGSDGVGGLANPLGTMFVAAERGGSPESAGAPLSGQGASLFVHELAHFNHFYFSGANALLWTDEFTSISRRNCHILGIPIPFCTKELHERAEQDVQDRGGCVNYPYWSDPPWGYVSGYARCGEWSLAEDFAETLSTALGATQYVRDSVREHEIAIERARMGGEWPAPHVLAEYAEGNSYDPRRLYERGGASDAAVLGEKARFVYEHYTYHLHRPQDADGDGHFWQHGTSPADCDDRNPVAGECVEVSCDDHGDCDDGDPCTVGQCASGRCRYDTVDSDGDGAPDARCGGTDCDDDDPEIFPGASRPCTNHCGWDSEQTCVGPAWSECAAPDSCECRPGETTAVPCASEVDGRRVDRCGTKTLTCLGDGRWDDPGMCDPGTEGPCSPGQRRSELVDETVVCAEGPETRPIEHIYECTAGCAWERVESRETWVGEPDVCNDRDDDCDGSMDPGCPSEVVLGSPSLSPKWGGGGGTLQEAACPSGHVLVGVRLTEGYCCFPRRPAVGAMQGLCAPVELVASGEPYRYDVTVATSDRVAMKTQGDADYFHRTLSCPSGQAVTGVDTAHGWYLDSVALRCGELRMTGEQGSYGIETRRTVQTESYFGKNPHESYDCPDGGVVTGLNAWTGNVVDALQLMCTPPSLRLR